MRPGQVVCADSKVTFDDVRSHPGESSPDPNDTLARESVARATVAGASVADELDDRDHDTVTSATLVVAPDAVDAVMLTGLARSNSLSWSSSSTRDP